VISPTDSRKLEKTLYLDEDGRDVTRILESPYTITDTHPTALSFSTVVESFTKVKSGGLVK
jgi:hypothetical protein